MFARPNFEIAPKDPYFPLFLGKDAPHSQLAGGFEGQNNAAGSGSSDYIYLLPFEVSGDKVTQLLRKSRVLQDAKLLPINRRMES